METRRISLVADSFLPCRDDRTLTVRQVADRLIDTGHVVQIVAPAPGLATYRGARIARIRTVGQRRRQIRAALEDFGPDLVQVTSPEVLGRKALKECAKLGLPTVVVEQQGVPRFPPDYWVDDVARRADRLLVTASWVADRLAGQQITAEVWRPGVDTDTFHPRHRDHRLHDHWAKSPGGLVVGYAGSLNKPQVVRRLVTLGGLPHVRLVVVGDGPQARFLKARIPAAKFTGGMAAGDLGVAVASLDMLVHPGRKETCCHSLRAAAASGVPVVAPRAGGAAEIVRHQQTGLFYDPSDVDGLRSAVAALARDPRRADLSAAARAWAEQRTWADAVDELVSVHYPAALAAGRRATAAA